MFDILRKSFATGIVTTPYPGPSQFPDVSPQARGAPEIDLAQWPDARPAALACPTGAIAVHDAAAERLATIDLGKCVFCGLCAEADPHVKMAPFKPLTARSRQSLIRSARYALDADGAQIRCLNASPSHGQSGASSSPLQTVDFEKVGSQLQQKIRQAFRRSLHIREVDAGSCNGCEIEIVNLNNPIYDIERFGIHFVASPRHADMLLVTGPVTRNMEHALLKTYQATPEPRLVVAVGACGCSGGMFGQNYATVGAVDLVIPVDVYIPGCPPNPVALLHGILTAISRL